MLQVKASFQTSVFFLLFPTVTVHDACRFKITSTTIVLGFIPPHPHTLVPKPEIVAYLQLLMSFLPMTTWHSDNFSFSDLKFCASKVLEALQTISVVTCFYAFFFFFFSNQEKGLCHINTYLAACYRRETMRILLGMHIIDQMIKKLDFLFRVRKDPMDVCSVHEIE